MSWLRWCKEELERAKLFSSEGDFYDGMTGRAVIELCEIFDKQNHSAMSAPLVSSIFNKLARQIPLTPLTGEDDEWSQLGKELYQNKRYPAVFKKGDIAFDLDARIFQNSRGMQYTDGCSRKKVSFPYSPNREYIRMESHEWALKEYSQYVFKRVRITTFDGEVYEGAFGLTASDDHVTAIIVNGDKEHKIWVCDIAEIEVIDE